MRLRNKKGMAVVEAALMMPWLAFLFVGVLDFGFYSYAAICTQNAARAVAMSQATASGATICQAAVSEMADLPNVLTTYACTAQSYPTAVSSTMPLTVCVATLTKTGSNDTNCSAAAMCADCPLDPLATSIQATVAYQTVPLVPIPGILMGKMTLTRTAEVRVVQ